jgi:hypothetical protein
MLLVTGDNDGSSLILTQAPMETDVLKNIVN